MELYFIKNIVMYNNIIIYFSLLKINKMKKKDNTKKEKEEFHRKATSLSKIKLRTPKQKEASKRQKKRYFKKKLSQIDKIDSTNKEIKFFINSLTRILYSDILPKECKLCGTTEDLHIHHIRYKYPIKEGDLVRLCRKCHHNIHRMINLTTNF